ncbi:hypothetical protein CKM354_000289500 [Cercospora kikuchii]|uniref:Heme haloperoxidase family profile domain-containing protein n=1 Tax=Cercospora kikuchii TaxID=84275 RepID=A0A9P3CAS2_9PEZI|nr:uncharacterized protein CKM354_000289500 [Cercospora kikuchii]GIZ39514.1 hypothetical protein CKM354_000289500 [Cercospora kikuchii]
MSMSLVLILSLACIALSRPAPSGHEYRAPGPNDVRSPCPGINSLANHGFIPRDGKNLTPAIMVAGLKEGINVGADFGLLVGQTATLANRDPLAGTFNLDDLRAHNFPIEHDVSLSRQDVYQGNNLVFNQNVFNEVLGFYQGMNAATIPVAAQTIWSRVETQRRLNPDTLIYGPRQLFLSLGETSLYLSVMGDPLTGVAPVSYVKSLFENERLPYEQGWQKSLLETNFVTLGAMIGQLVLNDAPDFARDLPNLNAGGLRDAFALRDPLTGIIGNATCGLLGTC